MCNFLEYKGVPLSLFILPLFPPSSFLHRISQGPLISPTSLCNHDNDTDTVHSSDSKVVYRRYASLFFIAGCASTDNELITLEIVHRYVEQMDKYYGNVCELDIIFNFQKAYFILDELLLAGEMQESSKKNVLRCISQEDNLEDMEVSPNSALHILSSHTHPLAALCMIRSSFIVLCKPVCHPFPSAGFHQDNQTNDDWDDIQVEEDVTKIM